MARSSVSKAVKAKQATAIKAAEKRGAARIVNIAESTGSPKAIAMKRLICDAAKLYKGKPAELANFYATVERMLLDMQERKREKRERAIKALDRGLLQLSDTRDLLRRMESGDDSYFSVEADAMFARAAVADAGTEMAQALLDLGLIDSKTSYYFVPEPATKREAQVTA